MSSRNLKGGLGITVWNSKNVPYLSHLFSDKSNVTPDFKWHSLAYFVHTCDITAPIWDAKLYNYNNLALMRGIPSHTPLNFWLITFCSFPLKEASGRSVVKKQHDSQLYDRLSLALAWSTVTEKWWQSKGHVCICQSVYISVSVCWCHSWNSGLWNCTKNKRETWHLSLWLHEH